MNQKLKERLLGSIVVITLAVIFVPMLFKAEQSADLALLDQEIPPMPEHDGASQWEVPQTVLAFEAQAQNPSSAEQLPEVPAPEEVVIIEAKTLKTEQGAPKPNSATTDDVAPAPKAKPAELKAKPAEPKAKPADPTAKPAEPTAKPAEPTAKPAEPKAKPAEPKAKPAKPKAKPAKSAPPENLSSTPEVVTSAPTQSAAAGQCWVVQLATFSNINNAHALVKKLKKQGYHAYSQTIPQHKSLTWVMVGPPMSPQQAQQLKDRLHHQFKLTGILVEHQALS
jgi:cell division septation protein DedD